MSIVDSRDKESSSLLSTIGHRLYTELHRTADQLRGCKALREKVPDDRDCFVIIFVPFRVFCGYLLPFKFHSHKKHKEPQKGEIDGEMGEHQQIM